MHNKICELTEEIEIMKNNHNDCKYLLQKQNKVLTVSKNSLKEDKEMMKVISIEKQELANRIAELEDTVRKLKKELIEQKKNSKELEELVLILNQNRKSLEAELNSIRTNQQVDSGEYFKSKKKLMKAKKSELAVLTDNLYNIENEY